MAPKMAGAPLSPRRTPVIPQELPAQAVKAEAEPVAIAPEMADGEPSNSSLNSVGGVFRRRRLSGSGDAMDHGSRQQSPSGGSDRGSSPGSGGSRGGSLFRRRRLSVSQHTMDQGAPSLDKARGQGHGSEANDGGNRDGIRRRRLSLVAQAIEDGQAAAVELVPRGTETQTVSDARGLSLVASAVWQGTSTDAEADPLADAELVNSGPQSSGLMEMFRRRRLSVTGSTMEQGDQRLSLVQRAMQAGQSGPSPRTSLTKDEADGSASDRDGSSLSSFFRRRRLSVASSTMTAGDTSSTEVTDDVLDDMAGSFARLPTELIPVDHLQEIGDEAAENEDDSTLDPLSHPLDWTRASTPAAASGTMASEDSALGPPPELPIAPVKSKAGDSTEGSSARSSERKGLKGRPKEDKDKVHDKDKKPKSKATPRAKPLAAVPAALSANGRKGSNDDDLSSEGSAGQTKKISAKKESGSRFLQSSSSPASSGTPGSKSTPRSNRGLSPGTGSSTPVRLRMKIDATKSLSLAAWPLRCSTGRVMRLGHEAWSLMLLPLLTRASCTVSAAVEEDEQ